MDNAELKQQIKEFAISEGADLISVAPVEYYSEYRAEMDKRMKENKASHADFMMPDSDRNFPERLSTATNAMPTAKAIIILAVYVYDEGAVYENFAGELRGKTARTYSYYPVIRQVAEKLTTFIHDLGYSSIHGQDVPLKYVADRIGLGCYGKNGVLLTEKYGSFIGLRNVLTDAPIAPDEFTRLSLCKQCDRCLKACSTGALYAPYKVNPRLCLNPITRQEKYIEPEMRSKMQNWISGCDICQKVCPINKNLQPREYDPRSGFYPEHHSSHKNLGGLEKTPKLLNLIKPNHPAIIRRNAAIALGNTGKGEYLTEVLNSLKVQIKNTDGELRDYFSWAIDKLSE